MHRLIKTLVISLSLGSATVPALEQASAMPMVAPLPEVTTTATEPVYYYYYRRYHYYRPRFYYYHPRRYYYRRWHYY